MRTSEQRSAAPLPPEAPPTTKEHWYGWQGLSTDAASLALLIGALATTEANETFSAGLAWTSLGAYMLGGPVSHFLHADVGKGLGSLGLRAGLPIVFGMIGAQLESCSPGEWFCGAVGAAGGGLLGIATAVTVDAAVLGYEQVPIEPEGVQNVSVSIGRDHAAIIAGGTF